MMSANPDDDFKPSRVARLERRIEELEADRDAYDSEIRLWKIEHDRKLGAAIARAEKAERALAEAVVWRTFADKPEPGRKFIALYNDGSGAAMFFAFDGGVIDSDG